MVKIKNLIKSMKTLDILLVIFVIVFHQNCKKDSSSINDQSINIASISPINGVIGTKLKIFENIPFDLRVGSVAITFSGVGDWILADSIFCDTIYTHVPFSAQSGDIKVFFLRDSVLLKNFIINEESPDEVKVCWSDLNYLIDHKIATYTRMPVLEEFKWTAEIIRDTVKISAGFYPGDYSVYYHLNLLNKGAHQLPQFISGYGLMDTDYGAQLTYPLDKGIIKIQDWDVDSIISGRVLSIPWNNNNYSFWYRFYNN